MFLRSYFRLIFFKPLGHSAHKCGAHASSDSSFYFTVCSFKGLEKNKQSDDENKKPLPNILLHKQKLSECTHDSACLHRTDIWLHTQILLPVRKHKLARHSVNSESVQARFTFGSQRFQKKKAWYDARCPAESLILTRIGLVHIYIYVQCVCRGSRQHFAE